MDFFVVIDGEEHPIIKHGDKIKLSGMVRVRNADGSMWSNAKPRPKTEFYLFLESNGSEQKKRKLVLYRESYWVQSDNDGKFSLEIETKDMPILRNASNSEIPYGKWKPSGYKIGYSVDIVLKDCMFTRTHFELLEPKVIKMMNAEMKKFAKTMLT